MLVGLLAEKLVGSHIFSTRTFTSSGPKESQSSVASGWVGSADKE